jgi:hypothetical protein
MGPIGCPKTSVQNYHSMLHNIPEERRYQIVPGLIIKVMKMAQSTEKCRVMQYGLRQNFLLWLILQYQVFASLFLIKYPIFKISTIFIWYIIHFH